MKSSKPIRILVVDDHFMVRMGLSASLNVEPDMEVVAEAGDGNAGSFSGSALDLQMASHGLGALAHIEEPEVAGRG